jgi:hypothetical protein
MATQLQVKTYIAHWFQFGKSLLITRQPGVKLRPKEIFQRDSESNLDYSNEFEQCWQSITTPPGEPGYLGDVYLEGTTQTIQELLSPSWDIDLCARCGVKVPLKSIGIQDMTCICDDMKGMPNPDTIQPREPLTNRVVLAEIRDRLAQSISK